MTAKRFLGMALVLGLLLGLVAGAAPAAAQGGGPIPIRIAWQPDPNVPLYLARDKNWFQEAGLQPEYVKFLAAPPMFAALQSESVDVADMGLAPAIIGRGQGIDIKFVTVAVDVSGTVALIAQKGVAVASAKDLRGKRVAAQKGTTAYFGLVRYLERDGVALKEIQYLDLNAPSTVPAFKKGEVDAALTWSPWQNMLVGMGGRRITTNKEIDALAPQVWAVRTEWARKNPEALQRFLKVIDRSFQQIEANRELAVRQLSETLNVDREIADEVLRTNDYPPLEVQGSPTYALSVLHGYPGATGGLSLAVKRAAEFLHSQGILKAMINPDEAIDPRPLQQYLNRK